MNGIENCQRPVELVRVCDIPKAAGKSTDIQLFHLRQTSNLHLFTSTSCGWLPALSIDNRCRLRDDSEQFKLKCAVNCWSDELLRANLARATLSSMS
jgi:hypothetical protein